MYQGGPYIPFYLATAEFFKLVHAHLSGDGAVMMNLFDAGDNREVLTATVATLRTSFPTVAVLQIGQANYMLFAFSHRRDLNSVRMQLAAIDSTLSLKRLAQHAAKTLIELRVPEETPVFTDDHAPLEEMTRRMAPALHRGQ